MNPFRPTKIEWITFITLGPVISYGVAYLMFGASNNMAGKLWRAYPLIFVLIFVSWYLHVLIMHLLQVKFPDFRHTVLRLSILTIAHLTLITASMILFFYGFDRIHFLGYHLNMHHFKVSILLGISVTLVATSIWEGEYIFIKWRESLAEKELLQQLTLQNEFESLKSQVNPHFLFNCFNTLSSLISEEPGQAVKFLDELSKVYRYLLRSNEEGLTTLKSELQFIQSYFQLLKSRYGNGVEMEIEVDRKYENYLLPSLSLQLLVENAVKHNIVSRQLPLVIDIFTTPGNKLIVNNNIQLKVIKAPSNKVGLMNIRTKYELLEHPGFQVMEDDKNFTVVLPLLWNKTSDNKLSLSLKAQ